MTNNWSINYWVCIKTTPVHQTFTSTATWPLTTCLRFTLRPKCWLSKRLKTRSTAEVADTFNVSQHQVQRIRKRYEETGDVFDKPRSGRPLKTTAREGRLLARQSKASPFSTAAELHKTWSPEVPMSTRTVCVNSASKWPPWSNQCPETQHWTKDN